VKNSYIILETSGVRALWFNNGFKSLTEPLWVRDRWNFALSKI